jgi:hypothetical protein
MAQNLVDKLIEALPELAEIPNVFHPNSIHLQNDSDGAGDYIAAWNYDKPLPAGFKVGK